MQIIPQLADIDQSAVNRILYNQQLGKYYARLDFKLQKQISLKTRQQNVINVNQGYLEVMRNMLLQQPIEFALMLTQYFAEIYLTVTPMDIVNYTNKKGSEALENVFRRFNSLSMLLQILVIGICFREIREVMHGTALLVARSEEEYQQTEARFQESCPRRE